MGSFTHSDELASAMTPAQVEAERFGWLTLTLTPELGPTRIHRAVAKAGNAAGILQMKLTDLEGLGFPATAARHVFDGRSRSAAEKQLKSTLDTGGELVCPADAAYPERLLEIYDPPTLLWVRGEAALLSMPGIAVVGTRTPTPYGTGMAQVLSRDLAHRGLAIFSGMARGVDTVAHKAALEAQGKTVAVWGTGIDVIYPKENKRLAEQILEGGGAILSEFPLGTFPAPQNFPVRNRILSGMSVGVLVIEAGEHSGTRITARLAIEQNREVFAVPGNVTNKNAWGPNTLIKQGAKLTATWEDIWEDLPTDVRMTVEELQETNESREPVQASLAGSLTGERDMPEHERMVLGALRPDAAVQLDELIELLDTRVSSSEIFAALFELELAGKVRQMPGKNYVKVF